MPYRVPVQVAVTTALAQGGMDFSGGSFAAPNAVLIDLPVNRLPVTIVPAGSALVTWPAIPAGQRGFVTALGMQTNTAADTRVTARINGVAVAAFSQIIGAIGTMETPTLLPAPIVLSPGDVFSVLIENIGAANISAMARTLGWRA